MFPPLPLLCLVRIIIIRLRATHLRMMLLVVRSRIPMVGIMIPSRRSTCTSAVFMRMVLMSPIACVFIFLVHVLFFVVSFSFIPLFLIVVTFISFVFMIPFLRIRIILIRLRIMSISSTTAKHC